MSVNSSNCEAFNEHLKQWLGHDDDMLQTCRNLGAKLAYAERWVMFPQRRCYGTLECDPCAFRGYVQILDSGRDGVFLFKVRGLRASEKEDGVEFSDYRFHVVTFAELLRGESSLNSRSPMQYEFMKDFIG